MKKIYLLVVGFLLILSSCKGDSAQSVYDNFVSKVENCSSYKLEGQMEITQSDGSDIFDVEVLYKTPNYYRVTYQNTSSNARQVLLKNGDGVYVLCPELNKEFKFESSWPLNSSHIYIVNKVVDDLKCDSSHTIEENSDYYVFKSKISHHVKKDLKTQSIYIDKKSKDISKITYNSDERPLMTLTVKTFDVGANISNSDFILDQIMKQETALIGEGVTTKCSEISFDNPYNLEITSNKDDKVTVLSFKGEKNYVIVYQELTDELLADTRMYDEFVMLDNTLGFISPSSLTFYLNNYEFKIISSTLTIEELMVVGNSIVMA